MGSLAGAGAGVLGVGLGWSLSDQLLILAGPCLFVAGWLTTAMLPDRPVAIAAADDVTRRTSLLQASIILLGTIAFIDMLCEGAVADWAAVYLRGSLRTTSVIAGLGYAVYLLMMMTVRLLGNRTTTRFPAHVVLPALAGVATIGVVVGLTINSTTAVLVGFICLGAGLALVVPMVLSACGRIPNVHPGRAVATVSACGWTGFVLGPPLIGALSSMASLRLALFVLPLFTCVIAVATAGSRALRRDG
jgi:fucose permease